jgi:hypothetical protein
MFIFLRKKYATILTPILIWFSPPLASTIIYPAVSLFVPEETA